MTLKKTIILYLIMIISGCSIIDFSPEEGIETYPDTENQIVGENDELYVSFRFEPEKTSAESLFRINDYKGNCSGSIFWEGNRMLFIPDKKMTAGRRYTLDYSGSVTKEDGGEVKAEILIPFFFMREGTSTPAITSEIPTQGTVITSDQSITIIFSKPMDRGSVKKEFTITPETKHFLEWNSESTELTITPENKWNNLSSYTFSFSPDICCSGSIPSEKEYSFIYYCDSSHVKPEVASLNTVLNNISLSYPVISGDLDTIKYKEGVEIEFTQEMKRESVENCLTFIPFIAGRKIWKNSRSLIFLPEKGWEWNKDYTLKISETAESENDIATGSEYSVPFTPDIRELLIDSINGKPGDGFPVSSFSETEALDIDTDPVQPHIYSFTYTFSEPFPTDEEKENAQSSINISSLFPPDASSPFPLSFSWIGDRSLTVKYSGFTPYNSTDNIDYYFMLSVKGGESGIINRAGSFLHDTVRQILRTK